MKNLLKSIVIIACWSITLFAGNVSQKHTNEVHTDGLNRESLSMAESFSRSKNLFLNQDEIFIQFGSISTSNINKKSTGINTQYVATVLHPDSASPFVRYLFDSKNLYKYKREDCNNIGLSRLVWGKLEDILNSGKRIYFCISGDLYDYPIEYFRSLSDTVSTINEIYDIRRLSGLTSLFESFSPDTIRKAAVFGGLDYKNNQDSISSYLEFRKLSKHVPMLPGTVAEVNYIDSVFRSTGVKVALQTGLEGSKSAFRAVGQSETNVLHVATHGFYDSHTYPYPENDLTQWMLGRVGILLSDDSSSPEYDGVVSGKDILNMDLGDLNLAVLSACQTGLGDVFEGRQYGLSQAFTSSKTRTVLASLWPVSDRATQLLMSEFYHTIINGLDKSLALKEAQRMVRNHVEGNIQPFEDPKYWAAFILIDDVAQGHVALPSVWESGFLEQFNRQNLTGEYVYEDIRDWHTFGNLLQPEDLLVYFYNYSTPSSDEEYVALVFSHDLPDGMIVPINSISSSHTIEEDWQTTANLIYTKLSPYLEGIKRIFFRSSGILSTIPLEVMIEWKYPNISCYRISAGSSLSLLEQPPSQPKKVLLYGGLTHEDMPYLPGAKEEVEDIYQMLLENDIYATLHSNDSGTVENFLSEIAGHEYDVIHFADHGSNVSLEFTNDHYSSLLEKVLELHLILFSGRNMPNGTGLKSRVKSIYEIQNKLTALDIACLDMSNVDLAVMSTSSSLHSASTSCRSYGLSEALKMAGVRSILATTVSVDDWSCRLLLKEFYRHYLSGLNKHDALKEAMKYLREYEYIDPQTGISEKRYENFYYWAPYILIDALE